MESFHVFLYAEPRTPLLRLEEVGFYLEHKCRAFTPELRSEFFTHWLEQREPAYREHLIDSLSYRMSRARIRNLTGRNPNTDPLNGEVEFERCKLTD
jgi:hypothetical protein